MGLVLQLLVFDEPLIVECDASGVGIGAVLHQGHGLVAFFSHQLASCHVALAAYECELMGLVLAMSHWSPYLWGRPFLICTDHYSLKFLFDQKLATIPQHQWVSKLLGFYFQVECKPGVTNVTADALSRSDSVAEPSVMAVPASSFMLFDGIHHAFTTDLACTCFGRRYNRGCTMTSGGSLTDWSWLMVGYTF
jgi:hypothetical protein